MKDSRWDVYIAAAEHYHWTPAQVGKMDPEFLEELRLFWKARSDHDAFKTKEREHGK